MSRVGKGLSGEKHRPVFLWREGRRGHSRPIIWVKGRKKHEVGRMEELFSTTFWGEKKGVVISQGKKEREMEVEHLVRRG